MVYCLKIFDDIVEEEKLHPKYKCLKDNLQLTGEQEILKEWVEGFIDRDNKIVKEFQTTFHSAFWEFFLFALFKEAGFTVDFSRNRPDFVISSPEEIYIEAVVSNIKKDGRDESTRGLDDILKMVVPSHLNKDYFNNLDEAIVRHSNAIISKTKKYKNEYSQLYYIKDDVPFVIALSAYDQISSGNEYHFPLMALLFGKYYMPETDSFMNKESIYKPGTNSPIPLGLFKDDNMKEVSAIIFSCTTTLGKLTSLSISQNKSDLKSNTVINIRHDYDFPNFKVQEVSVNTPEYLSDGIFVFYNPFAANPLPRNTFKGTNVVNVYREREDFLFEGENAPIVARLNIVKSFLRKEMKKEFMYDIIEKFNSNFHISLYEVLEIDLNIYPLEMTLKDKKNQKICIVDLSDKDVAKIKNQKIKEGDIVTAGLNTTQSSNGIIELVEIAK